MTEKEFTIEAWKEFFEIQPSCMAFAIRRVRRMDKKNLEYACAWYVEVFRMHGNHGPYGHGVLRAALRCGKRYARLARKYA